MQTYLIADFVHWKLKIGVSEKPEKRLRTLQCANPHKLELIALINGNREYDLHRQFKQDRLNGEWFAASDNLLRWAIESTPLTSSAKNRIQKELKQRRERQLKPLNPAEETKAIPAEAVMCDDIYSLAGEDDSWLGVASDIIEQHAPEDLEACFWEEEDEGKEEHKAKLDLCQLEGGIRCDWHLWTDAIFDICLSGYVASVGINDEDRLLYLTLKPITTQTRRDWFLNNIPDISFMMDCLEWDVLLSVTDRKVGLSQHKINGALLWVERLVLQQGNCSNEKEQNAMIGFLAHTLGLSHR